MTIKRRSHETVSTKVSWYRRLSDVVSGDLLFVDSDSTGPRVLSRVNLIQICNGSPPFFTL